MPGYIFSKQEVDLELSLFASYVNINADGESGEKEDRRKRLYHVFLN
jgi:hypothetical protein